MIILPCIFGLESILSSLILKWFSRFVFHVVMVNYEIDKSLFVIDNKILSIVSFDGQILHPS